ncbi:hypothetical protein [Parerythrobacter aestuarii]|uniref:hypothetical protein n=1 Tax=Parerythrobacter aestuarii TaxID=3020909 RepID=UPI0024DE28F3|nr:hypothetical protein [Parerythrobacter aestuarii]
MRHSKGAAAALVFALAVAGCQATSPGGAEPVAVPPPPPPPPPPPAIGTASTTPYVVVRGSASALERFPRGTRKFLNQQICLNEGETLTLVHPTSGRKVTFGGAGCNKQAQTPDDAQSGATSVGE